jgi:hypothetical protein|tara:strand:- start:895 stop:1509 length:615 start_codon:yes stop_codon:yes gene_type:complete
MGALIDLNSIKSAPINESFFPFFSVLNCITEEGKALPQNFPDLNKGGSYPSDMPGLSPVMENLIAEIESKEMQEALSEKFGINLDDVEVVTTIRGYSRLKDGQIHTDSKTKVLTLLLYLNESWEEDTGLLRMLKNNHDLEDFIEEIPATLGSLVVFKVTENCWHGFHPFEGKRLSLQMNYIKKESVSQHVMRHRLSSFIKKLFK